MLANNIQLARIGYTNEGKYYRATHDTRPSAPNGTIWRVERVELDTAYLWCINAHGLIIRDKCKLDELFDDCSPTELQA